MNKGLEKKLFVLKHFPATTTFHPLQPDQRGLQSIHSLLIRASCSMRAASSASEAWLTWNIMSCNHRVHTCMYVMFASIMQLQPKGQKRETSPTNTEKNLIKPAINIFQTLTHNIGKKCTWNTQNLVGRKRHIDKTYGPRGLASSWPHSPNNIAKKCLLKVSICEPSLSLQHTQEQQLPDQTGLSIPTPYRLRFKLPLQQQHINSSPNPSLAWSRNARALARSARFSFPIAAAIDWKLECMFLLLCSFFWKPFYFDIFYFLSLHRIALLMGPMYDFAFSDVAFTPRKIHQKL